MSGKRVIITGASGLLGRGTCRALLNEESFENLLSLLHAVLAVLAAFKNSQWTVLGTAFTR